MVKTKYLVLSVIGFITMMYLNYLDSEFKYIALGFGLTVLVFGVFGKEEDNNLNNKKELIIKNDNHLPF